MGKGKKYSYGHGGGMMMPVRKMMMKDGGQALFDALKKKGYKKMGGQTESMLSKMTKGGMMDMSDPAVLKMKYGGSMTDPKIKMMGGSMKKKMQDGGKVMFVKTKDSKDAPEGFQEVGKGRMMKEKRAKRKVSKGKGFIDRKLKYGGSTYGKKKK